MKSYDLTVVMPVYNEAEAIGGVLNKWKQMLDALHIRYRICAYNDGSKDNTGTILERITTECNGEILGITKPNSGHGPTILQGYREAIMDSEWVFQVDSDDEMGPESFPQLWKLRENYDFLVGQRDGRKQPLARKIISFVSRLCVRLFYGKGIWDVNTPYRLMRASVFERFYNAIPEDTFAPNVILSGLAAHHHLRMLELPVPQHDRTTGEVSIKKWKLLKAAAKSFMQTILFALKNWTPTCFIIAGTGIISFLLFSKIYYGFKYLTYYCEFSIFAEWFCLPIKLSSTVEALLLAAIVIAVLIYGIFRGISIIANNQISHNRPINDSEKTISMRNYFVWCLISATIILLICSRCSPLYPFNDWVDSNAFLTVGKSMLYGLVPYKDLIEHKGPFLYMLHAVAALISERSFFGVFLLEICSLIAFLFMSCKIALLYVRNFHALWIPILAFCVCTTSIFVCGDSAEEFCLPLLGYGLLCGLRLLKPDITVHKYEFFLLGIVAGAILWTKYLMLGFYIGWGIFFVIHLYRHTRFQTLRDLLIFGTAGVIGISLPILFYFALHGAVGDLFKIYFYDNMFLYQMGGKHGLLYNLYGGFSLLNTTRTLFIIITMTLLYTLAYPRTLLRYDFYFIALTGLSLFFFTFAKGRGCPYYALSFFVFIPFLAISFIKIIRNATAKQNKSSLPRKLTGGLSLLICASMAYLISDNTSFMHYKKADLPHYQIAEIINSKPNPTLLNYNSLDLGIYNAAGLVPTCKAFCKLNIPIPEMKHLQKKYFEEGLIDFIVTSKPLEDGDSKYQLKYHSKFEEGNYYLYERITTLL